MPWGQQVLAVVSGKSLGGKAEGNHPTPVGRKRYLRVIMRVLRSPETCLKSHHLRQPRFGRLKPFCPSGLHHLPWELSVRPVFQEEQVVGVEIYCHSRLVTLDQAERGADTVGTLSTRTEGICLQAGISIHLRVLSRERPR